MIRTLLKTVLVTMGVVLAQPMLASAQSFPDKSVTIIVPWPAGGGTDILARPLGQRLGEIWNQPVVIDNRPGAVGFIGAQAASRAKPDGYTIMMTSMTITTNKVFLDRDELDPINDFEPITLLAGAPHVLVVRPDLPVQNVEELLALAKSGESSLKYSSAGPGSPWHLAAELFRTQAGIEMLHVPYKGGAPAIMDLLGKQVDLSFANITVAKPHIDDGTLRPLGVTTKERPSMLPDLPTLAEQGLQGYDFTSWFAFYAPKGTDAAILEKLSKDIRAAINTPEVKRKYIESGLEVIGSSPEELTDFMKQEVTKWQQVKKAHLQ